MDEQRLAAYLQLIQALLECPSGEEGDILEAHRELVDAYFVQVMEAVAANMAAEDESNAGWLQNLAALLANYVSNTATPEEYFSFLGKVLQATTESNGNRQFVYPILQENLDKLDLNFAQILQAWDTSTFIELASEESASIAAAIGEFGNLIQQFPLGRRTWNLEIGIACYTAALEVYKRDDYPEQWANNQNNLANSYSYRIAGVRAENIELAIAGYTAALEVYTRNDYLEQWAMTQNNLGAAYSDRIEGVRAANIELGIACYRSALIVYTPENYPENWAGTQNNLGNAYSDRIEGVRAANIELAIACFRSALKVYIPENYPEKWAMTQNNLGNAYSDRIEGVRAANIELAIACYRSALKVYTPENYPEKWAATQNNLGNAYKNRIEGVRAANIELAIACYRLALEIRTPIAFPLDCLQSGRNLGNTAFTAGFWDIALEGFDKAIQAVEKSRSWATSDNIRQQMIAESIGVYEKAIQAAVNNNQLEKAIEYCDRTRAQRLVDLMHSNDLYASGEIPPAVQKYLDEFKAKQQEIDAEVEQLRNPSEGDKGLVGVGSQSRSRADTSAYTKKIQELEGEKQQIWENIRRLDPVLAGQVQVVPMQFAAMQQLIDNSQTAILCFYTTQNDTHVFVIYKDKAPQIHTCLGEGWASFQQWIFENWLSPYLADKKVWRQGMGEFLSQLSRRLKVDELIGNCLDGIQELIVIPHLYLHQIPLAALPVNTLATEEGGHGGTAPTQGGSKNHSDNAKAVEPMAVRLFVLIAQYRSQIDFTEEAIAGAQNGWHTLKEGLLFGSQHGSKLGWDVDKIDKLTGQNSTLVQQFQAAMDDDFNTPGALTLLFELAKELGKEGNVLVHQGKTETAAELLQQKWVTLVNLAGVLGLEVSPEAETEISVGGLTDGEIEAMIQQRKDARKAKNFAEGDRIRNELKDKGITLIDQKDGITIWHRG
ncbi:MAG TPA: hypothetical protein DGO89_14305 [Microcoleaceae bacterium UBA9251]|nr:hypothetical protein [Microcoleaceae cyanobacterium UBA9251]